MPKSSPKEPTPPQRVAAREQFLKRVVDFTVNLLIDHGRVVSENQGSSNIHIIRELLDFEGFSFKTDLGQTMMGGNDVVIWFHPGREFKLLRDDRDQMVLAIYSGTLPLTFEERGFRLEVFKENDSWERFIIDLMKNKKKIFSKIATAERKAKRDKERSDAQQERERAFQERAKRVRIAI